jgi:hypothetical protein
MAEKIRLVQGDTAPALTVTLTDTTTNTAINITGATVRLKFRAVGSETLRGTLTGTVTSGANGTVVFFWSDQPTILDGDAGDYEGEIEITFADTTVQTVFDLLKFKLRQDF